MQQTIARSICARDIGLHSGQPVTIKLHQAPINHGIVFRRIDLNIDLPIKLQNVANTTMCTTIAVNTASIKTVEHLLSALAGLGITNLLIEIDGPELPAMDGSSAPFVNLIQMAGIISQDRPEQIIKILETIRVEDQDKWVQLEPATSLQLELTLSYQHPVLNKTAQTISLDFAKNCYIRELSRARTYGFYNDYEYLKQRKLALGANLNNAVVVTDTGIMNPGGLRYADEFVRHKALDVIGDLYLIGHKIIGKFSGFKPSHELNYRLLMAMQEQPLAWRLEPNSAALA